MNKSQSKIKNVKSGLYIVSTPIGNLEDITFRAVEILRNSDFILCEDTRVSKNLLNKYEIKSKLISNHKFNEKKNLSKIISYLRSGKIISIISDAGTPSISDPGAILINACLPFLSIETIDNFYNSYLQSKCDGMFGVIKKKNYFWNDKGIMINKWKKGQGAMNTKTVEVINEAAHCLYAGRMDKIGEGIWMGNFNIPGDIELFSMSEAECFDVDYPWQFEMLEKLYEE